MRTPLYCCRLGAVNGQPRRPGIRYSVHRFSPRKEKDGGVSSSVSTSPMNEGIRIDLPSDDKFLDPII